MLTEADIVVAHNGDRFDIKKINARLAVHGFPPPSPFKSIDTLKIARAKFKFDSNRLDHLAQYFGIGRKLPHVGKDMWRGCIDGDPKMWAMMRRYNRHDVWLLHQVYSKLKAWGSHPDLRAYSGSDGCPVCLSTEVQRRGTSVSRTRQYQRLHCQSCGHWFQGERIT